MWRFEFRSNRRLWIVFSVIAFVLSGHFFTYPLGTDSDSFWKVVWDIVQRHGDVSWRFVFSILFIWATALTVLSVAFGWIAQAVIRIIWITLRKLVRPNRHRFD